MDDAAKIEDNLVRGCQSQVWLQSRVDEETGRLHLTLDSDAHIVKGLVGILVMLLSGKSPQEILDFDLRGLFDKLKLENHLVPARSNGLHSMVRKIHEIAVSVR